MRAHPLPAAQNIEKKFYCRSRGTHSSFEELGILPRKVGRIFASGKLGTFTSKPDASAICAERSPERRPAGVGVECQDKTFGEPAQK